MNGRLSPLMERAGLASVAIVVPAYNEEENLPVVLDACLTTCRDLTDDFEIVVVDDASTDATNEVAGSYAARDSRVRVIRNPRNVGCHPSQLTGFRQSTADAALLLPADRQIMPDQLLSCLEAMVGADYVCTNRVSRADPLHRRLVSRFYNWTVRTVLRLPVHDVDSSVLVRRRVIERIAPEVDAHTSFVSVQLVALAVRAGFRVAETTIEHHPRVAGRARGLNFRDTLAAPLGLLRLWVYLLRIRRQGPRP